MERKKFANCECVTISSDMYMFVLDGCIKFSVSFLWFKKYILQKLHFQKYIYTNKNKKQNKWEIIVQIFINFEYISF